MQLKSTAALLAASLAMMFAGAGIAGPREDQLAQYAKAAKAANPAFSGFSAERGKTLHTQNFGGGKPDTPACTACHGKDTRAGGRTPAGKAIDPMAVSATPSRYTEPAKVEKWFKRNCNEVLGRECSAQEKGDWLTFMSGQ
ncbi:MAG: DUF1924 domain-containing protein [Sulfuritalea sp.]|nr:DUF1924 domain-containing protein [Sulfuritalea sp.]